MIEAPCPGTPPNPALQLIVSRVLVVKHQDFVLTSSLPDIRAVRVDAILALREEYRREMDCQIVHDSWHARGFTHSYLFNMAERTVGYGET